MAITNRHKMYLRSLVDEADEVQALKDRIDRKIQQYFAEGYNSVTVEDTDVEGVTDIEHMYGATIANLITQLQTIQTALDAAGVMDNIIKAGSPGDIV